MKVDKITGIEKMARGEGLCIHKNNSCEKESVCDGKGKYVEDGKVRYCGREVYREIELWRTFY